MNQSQRSPRDHIVKDELSNLPKVDLENYQKNFKNLLQFDPKNQLPKLGCRELMNKKCLDEGLAQKLVRFKANLTNFFLQMEL